MYFRVIGLIPDEPEDMWHAYNLIAVGDRLRATTIRYINIAKEMSRIKSDFNLGCQHVIVSYTEHFLHAWTGFRISVLLIGTLANPGFFRRRVQNESSTGSVSSSKVRTTLTIQVEGVEYDTQACVLRIKGRNCQENQYVKVMYEGDLCNTNNKIGQNWNDQGLCVFGKCFYFHH